MGFSVSGSAAIIFAAMFIGFGMFHSATVNGFESVSDAQEDRTDRTLTRQNTDIALASATYTSSNGGTLTVTVNNTGATGLAIDEVDLLGNNEYLIPNGTTVDGDDSATGLWLPGEQLTLTRSQVETDPGQVKVVTGPGVADTGPTEAT